MLWMFQPQTFEYYFENNNARHDYPQISFTVRVGWNSVISRAVCANVSAYHMQSSYRGQVPSTNTEKKNISGVYKMADRRVTTNITTSDLIPNRTNMGRNNTMFGVVLLASVITVMLQWVWLIQMTSFSLSNRPVESADPSTCDVSMVS